MSKIRVNSAIHSQIAEDIVYLFVNNTVYTLNVNNTEQSTLESVTPLQKWDKQIKSPIHYVYTTKSDPNYLELTNVC